MQKNLKLFFVHYLQKQFYPFNPRLLGKLHQHPRGTPSPKDAARKFHEHSHFRVSGVVRVEQRHCVP